jgi:molecular chaperone GrpE (heat shock protein)
MPNPILKVKKPLSRADRLAEVTVSMEDCKTSVEVLKEELESWKQNMPENLQEGSKTAELEEAIDALEAVADSLGEAIDNAESVSFPGMY